MKFRPLKRVGSPASLRGVRGPYLTTMILFTGGSLFVFLIILMLPLNTIFRLVLSVGIIFFMLFKYNNLKSESKGDLNKSLKNRCRKTFVIKPKNNETSKSK